MKTLPILIALLSSACWAQVIFQSDFEEDTPQTGKAIKKMSSNDAKIDVVNSVRESAARSEVGANRALVIQGGEEEKHAWQPAGDITLPDLKEGYIYVGFMLKNASFDASLFGIQVSHNQPGYRYSVYQSMRLYPTHISLSGTGRGLGKEQLSSGKDAKWMKVEWIFPTPGAEGNPRLILDGVDQGEIALKPGSDEIDSINLIRVWLPDRRGEDTKFLIDDVIVASAPSLKELSALVKQNPKPAMP